MKFKRQAKDRVGALLEEGDIIQLHDDGDTIAVINRVVRHGREKFPDLYVSKITTNWLGKVEESREKTIIYVDDYKRCRRLDPDLLRDDVPKYERAKVIQQRILDNLEASK